MKRLISCASYYGSGSSAIIDLIGEYKHVKSLTNYEFRFIQDIDGLMDLEYHLVQNPNRHNSGHALKRFGIYPSLMPAITSTSVIRVF